jgi:F-type H+-transporting ATPase subunit delta
MIAGSVARRYAKALLALGVEEQTHESMGRELQDLAHAFAESDEIRQALLNPVFPLSERRAVLDGLCRRLGLSHLTRNAAMLLLDRGRTDALPDVAREFGALLDEHAGRIRARVIAAAPMAPDVEVRLKVALERMHGKKVVMQRFEDPSLIAGVVAEVGDMVYDGSLKHQMKRLRAALLYEA